MTLVFVLLSMILGAYVGKFIGFTLRILPEILLEEANLASTREPRDVFSLFFKNPLSDLRNTPILGYFIAKEKLQTLYLEIGLSLLFGINAIITDSGAEFILICAMTTLMICCFITDFEHGILPDQFTLSLLWIALIASLFHVLIPPHEAIAGAVGGYGLFWFMNEIYRIYRGQDGMFPGDFKFNAALGAIFGIQELLPILILALILVIVMTIFKYFNQNKPALANFVKQEISYGCYAAFVAFIALYINLLSIDKTL